MRTIALFPALLLAGCMNHYVLHPRLAPTGARSGSEVMATSPNAKARRGVHGDLDHSARVKESRRLAQRLTQMGRPVELLVIPGAGHFFNFRDRDKARVAWDATLAFLDRHLRP
jgi:dipeptidyl aminopeptidase/acylaminoacyl peptidase